jgi:Flp pilus assembly protein TadD
MLLESTEIRSAFVTGIRRPRIVLPVDPAQCPPSPRVLAHELAHVSNHDLAWQALGTFLRTAFWFQPFNWFLHARHEALAEELADAAALRAGRDEVAYARELCACAGPCPMPAAGFSLVRRPSRLRLRIQRLFSPHMKTNHQLRPAAALAGAFLLGTALVGGVLLTNFGTRLQAAETTPATAPKSASAHTGLAAELTAALAIKGDDSIPVLTALADKYPDDGPVAYWLAVRKLEAGQQQAAETRFLRLLAENRTHWVTTWSAVRLAQIARQRNDTAKSDAFLQQARGLVASHGDGGQSIERFFGNAGIQADLKSALALEGEASLRALDRLHAENPDDATVAYWLAVRKLDTGATDEAEQLFAKALATDRPNWTTTWSAVRLYQIAYVRKDLARAEQLQNQAHALAARHGDGGQNITSYLEEVRASRAVVDPQLNAALALPAKDSLAALEQLHANYPRDPYVAYWLAVNLRQKNDIQRARPLFEEVVAKDMKNWVTAWATLELAGIAKATGDTAKSASLAQTAIRLGEEYGNGGQSISKAVRTHALLPNG